MLLLQQQQRSGLVGMINLCTGLMLLPATEQYKTMFYVTE